MRLSLACLLLGLLCWGAPGTAADEAPGPLSVEQAERLLVTLVDLPTSRQRAQMARRLAERDDVPLTTWVRAMRGFGTYAAVPAGSATREVRVPVGDAKVPLLFTTYVPEAYEPSVPAPLLIVHHGSGGDGREDWRAWQGTADALGLIVVCPGDPAAAKGYTASAAERDAAWAALRLARRTFNVDENRVYATGVSRGGHLVWDLALRHPDRFAAIAPLIGAPRLTAAGGQNNLRYLENLVDVPIRDLQGSHDDPLLLQNLRYAFSKLARYGAKDAKLVEFPKLAHGFELGGVPWTTWLAEAKRSPTPRRVIRRFAKEGEGRAFYVDVLQAKGKVKEIPQITADRRWSSMTAAERRIYMADFIEQRTARVEVEVEARGVFRIRAQDTKRIRLLLTPEMIDEGDRVEVRWNGRRLRRSVKRSARVLLTEFAERFDRTFLPVAELTLP